MYLQLFDSVRITEGVKRAIIFDTSTGFINFIPKSFSALISDPGQDYTLLRQELDNKSKNTLDQYLQFIQHNRLGIIVNHKEELANFRRSDEKQMSISDVDYFIFDLYPIDFTSEIIGQIDQMGIKFVQLRILNDAHIDDIINLLYKLEFFNETSVNEVSIVLSYNSELENYIIDGEIIKSSIYLQFLFHSCKNEEKKIYGNIEVLKITKAIRIPESCGCVNLNNMNSSHLFYTEALNHNSCLYKKMGIDKDGNIRNCPSMPKAFGNMKNTTLRTAFQKSDFKEYWIITKNEIAICKDCEFRYICTDCRAYTEKNAYLDGIDISKPFKCGYNPYTTEWIETSDNPLKNVVTSLNSNIKS